MKVGCNNDCPRGEFDGCCYSCPLNEKCADKCEDIDVSECVDAIFETENAVELFETKSIAVIDKMTYLLRQKEEIELAESKMREDIKTAMEQCGLKSFENDNLKITYVDESTRETIDSKKLKQQLPDIAAKFLTTSNVKSSVRIKLKDVKV